MDRWPSREMILERRSQAMDGEPFGLFHGVCDVELSYLSLLLCYGSGRGNTRAGRASGKRRNLACDGSDFPRLFCDHTKIQKFSFDEKFMLQRMDYITDVAGGVVTHYCFDHKEIGSIVFPMFRRVLHRDPETNKPLISGLSSFLLDYVEVSVRDK